MNLDKNRVVIGLSGGVDSTVAAYLLKEQGYEVIGITMKTWDDPTDEYAEKIGGCCSLSAVEDARRVAAKLDIPFYVLNFKKPFKEHVIDYFVDEYEHGRTPNPCIACNKFIKFDRLLKKAHELGAYYVATGHYAKIEQDEETERYVLKASKEKSKDQTYMLYNLSQWQLQHMMMPLGSYESKLEIRKIAEKLDFSIASKPDSQEICFIPDDDYARYVTENATKKILPGNFVDGEGNVLGKHKGIIYYTVGQRKGLGITFGKPMYVVEIKADTNEVVLGENDRVFAKGLIAEDTNWIVFEELKEPLHIMAKIRHAKRTESAMIIPMDDTHCRVLFEEPQRAVTPGQAVVFYKDDLVIGGGTIQSSF